MSQDDDSQIGKVLSRREVLAFFGAAGAALLVACSDDGPAVQQGDSSASAVAEVQGSTATQTSGSTANATTSVPSCVVKPELTEGPYFVDVRLNRSDIRGEAGGSAARPGTPLTLTFNVSRVATSGCTPLANAMVDIWHCDALGIYSSASDPGFNTTGQQFLRGYQMSDANGKVQFTTIYPGWYQGRAVHIHFKIRVNNTEFTSQLFFDETVTDQAHAQQPYVAKGTRTLKNEGDGIYRGGGSQLLLTPTRTNDGYAATFDIGIQA